MVKYKSVAFVENNKAGWRLFETATKLVLGESVFEEHVVDRVKSMEKGGAFNGNTPQFFTNPPFNLDFKYSGKTR